MDDALLDSRLKTLIFTCKETGNTKKVAVVSFILLSNQVDEIGIKLGMRPRKKESNEKIHEYLTLLNSIFESNLKVRVFQEEDIGQIKQCETLFLRSRGDIPLSYTRMILEIYYDLRKLEVPNLHEALDLERLETTGFGFASLLSPQARKKKRDDNNLRPLILQKIKEKQASIQKQMESNFNAHQLETAIYLNTVKNSLNEKNKRKIIFNGALKDNISYQMSIEEVFKYLVLGVIFILFSLGIVILIEMSMIPSITSYLNSWSFCLFGGVGFLILIYLKYHRKKGG